ncbi:C40 family peptidase [Luteipulveratus flavus]|uniref:Peptidoglycan-binding protein n=1 Tax=Luteipulveratus flavus TaxID=3031728 RepID=A0ABT6C4N6_9MICO|nr:peptidoglycan-binding protein [Luteipulveratus sp. YIM 133296]MDF8263840.1 peptidoglycan-binding protein [Luteipulveratus sp. YIM 133296]
MASHEPQHLRPRPPRSAVRPALQVRRGTLLATGTALAVPTSLGSVLSAAPAQAAPLQTAAPTAALPGAAPSVGRAALPAAPTAPVTVLRYGSRGDLVEVVQQRLRISVDGSFGPQTLTAVKAFQRTKDLQVDGVVGPYTWAALGGLPSGGGEDPAPSCTSYVVRYGAKGDVVEVLQRRLGIQVDGDFGPWTLDAVKAYQRSHDLTVDGIVGPNTWRALGGYPCSEEPPSRPSGATGQDVLDIAKRYIGYPYSWGGETPETSFDCSGLTQYVYRQVGIYIPRTSLEQSRFRPGVDLDDLHIGDLVFFYSPVHHVGIYAGDGTIIDASRPGTNISIHRMYTEPVKAIRLL